MDVEALIEADLELVRYLSLDCILIAFYDRHYLISKSSGRGCEPLLWREVQIDFEHFKLLLLLREVDLLSNV